MLAEVGILGTAMFIGILAAIAIPLVRIRRRAQDPVDALMAAGLLLGMLAFLFAGAFLDLAYARYFWLLVGLAAAAGTVLAPDAAASTGVRVVAHREGLMHPSSRVPPRPSRLRGGGADR
jgi:hypothetical protein